MGDNGFMTVSLCIIAFNEEKVIGGLLGQVKAQTYSHKLTEIVLVDSCSTDQTAEIYRSFREENRSDYMDIKILENKINNERGNQASGWNTAIRNAAGDIIIRVDAHAEIPADFIEQNVRLIERGEYVCGGARPNKIESPTPFKEMLFLAESSMFGSSVAGYRRKTQTERYVSSVFHGAYRREVFEKVGGFNRDLGRTEDNELHYRIREAGYKILQSESIISYQYIRGTLSSMMKQKYGNGKWVGLTLGVCMGCLSSYHFIPFLFVFTLLCCVVMAVFGGIIGAYWLLVPLAALMGVYFLAAVVMSVAAVIPCQKRNITMLLLPAVFFLLHVSYGWGTMVGLVKMPLWKAKLDGSAQREIEEVRKSVINNSKHTSEADVGGRDNGGND